MSCAAAASVDDEYDNERYVSHMQELSPNIKDYFLGGCFNLNAAFPLQGPGLIKVLVSM